MKNLWKVIKNISNINKKEDSRISQLSHNGKNINNNLDMANSFNEFFTEVDPTLHKQFSNSNIFRNPDVYLPPRIPYSISLYHSPPEEISEIISSLDDSKSSCPSSIPIKLLKIANEHISFTFSDICNTSFNEGIFPDKNKRAKVVTIHKDGSTKEINNYRPISLLSIFSKIMEKIVAVRLNNFLELHFYDISQPIWIKVWLFYYSCTNQHHTSYK